VVAPHVAPRKDSVKVDGDLERRCDLKSSVFALAARLECRIDAAFV
jgi:hypothetical protein